MALAVAFIMGAPVAARVNSFVDNSIMPFIGVLVPSGDWKTATLALGPVNLGTGPFLAECINFIVIALVVFMIAKKVMGDEKGEKKELKRIISQNKRMQIFLINLKMWLKCFISSKKPGYKYFPDGISHSKV